MSGVVAAPAPPPVSDRVRFPIGFDLLLIIFEYRNYGGVFMLSCLCRNFLTRLSLSSKSPNIGDDTSVVTHSWVERYWYHLYQQCVRQHRTRPLSRMELVALQHLSIIPYNSIMIAHVYRESRQSKKWILPPVHELYQHAATVPDHDVRGGASSSSSPSSSSTPPTIWPPTLPPQCSIKRHLSLSLRAAPLDSGARYSQINVMLFGLPGVGKTSIARRYHEGWYAESYDPRLGEFPADHMTSCDGRAVTLSLSISQGSEWSEPWYHEFRWMHFALYVYRVDDQTSFDEVNAYLARTERVLDIEINNIRFESWQQYNHHSTLPSSSSSPSSLQLDTNLMQPRYEYKTKINNLSAVSELSRQSDQRYLPDMMPGIIVAAQSDRTNHQVEEKKARELASRYGMSWMSCSAKQNEGITPIFESVIRHFRECHTRPIAIPQPSKRCTVQ